MSPQITEVDSFIEKKPVAVSDSSSNLINRLEKSDLSVTQWGKAVFATSQNNVNRDGPALLIYVPDAYLHRHDMAAILTVAKAWHKVDNLPLVTLKLLIGPFDEALLKQHGAELAAQAIIYSVGEYSEGRPLVSLGMKGLLEIELKAKTLEQAAPSAYSEIMPAASWIIVRALDSLKSEAQEVQVDGFEDTLAALPALESRKLLASVPQHATRLAARLQQYGLEHYIFDLGAAMVLQTEFRVPTVNITAIECGTFKKNGRLKLPPTARARVDFHLVPDQEPSQVFEALQNHFSEKNFEGLETVQLAGAYPASRTPLDTPFVLRALDAVEAAAGNGALLAPISPFAGPLALLRAALANVPAICIGLDTETATDSDVKIHARLLARLLFELAELYPPLDFGLPPKDFSDAESPND